MTLWAPSMFETDVPLYVAIADDIARAVREGELRPGDRLPTHRDLARTLGVNVVTVTRGYAEAARRGLVEGEVGRGTFVRGRPRPDPVTMEALHDREVVDFHFNLPASSPGLLEPGAILAELLEDAERVPLHEGYTAAGLDAHRAAGAAWLQRSGLPVDPARVLVCGGAQHAMAVTLASLAGPGDLVLTDELTYPGVRSLASVLRLRLSGLPSDAHGLLPDALDAACRRGNVRALYTMPTVHNPTGVVMPSARRAEIAAVLAEHGVPVVEDDTYGLFCDDAPSPLCTHVPELGYFLTGTSKTISAGLRIGWVAAPAGSGSRLLVERLAAHVGAVGWMAAPLMAEIATRWIESGGAERMLSWKRREVAARRRFFEQALGEQATASHRGSPHVWLPVPPPWRAEQLLRRARERQVAVSPADLFVVGRAQTPHAVRVCLATPRSRDDVRRGLDVLADLLAGVPEAGRAVV